MVVSLNEGEKCVVVWSGVFGVDIALDGARGRLATIGEFFDQLIPEHLAWGC